VTRREAPPGRWRRFQQVDVFSPEPGRGNPVAVVLDGDGVVQTAEASSPAPDGARGHHSRTITVS
jgi:hypothetical protein